MQLHWWTPAFEGWSEGILTFLGVSLLFSRICSSPPTERVHHCFQGFWFVSPLGGTKDLLSNCVRNVSVMLLCFRRLSWWLAGGGCLCSLCPGQMGTVASLLYHLTKLSCFVILPQSETAHACCWSAVRYGLWHSWLVCKSIRTPCWVMSPPSLREEDFIQGATTVGVWRTSEGGE